MSKLLLATRNRGKLVEVAKILEPVSYVEVVSPEEFKDLEGIDPEETGTTFEENALIKAREYAELAGVPTVADDSGLEVQALDGKPGVYSKRFFSGTDEEKNQQLLEMMAKAESKDRSARFVSVVAYVNPVTGLEKTFEGRVEGKISQKQAGTEGFGYDPVFIPNGYKKTFAQLGVEEKNKLSHRARAFSAFKDWLSKQ